MDKLRALQYFIVAAEERSLSGAARRLAVSVPAVAKLVTALERNVGTDLFERTARGLALTADGQRYRETCGPILEQLAQADAAIAPQAGRPRGTLVIGAPAFLMQHQILPALTAFHDRYPDIQIDHRVVGRPADPASGRVDVFVLMGWPRAEGLVHRRIAETKLITCASPAYWALHGLPREPQDMERYTCFPFVNPEGTTVDVWHYTRGDERRTVNVHGWLASDHRDVGLHAVLAGEGVGRFTDITVREYLRTGQLVQALADWDMLDAPPINLMYRAAHRRNPRVRPFVDFITEHFRRQALAQESGNALVPAARPYWYGRNLSRASAATGPGRGRGEAR
jgi:DNA-binding transcriptional LysR family regulator